MKATTEISTEPGWLRTGDLVMRDEQDGVHYLDRLKEMTEVKGLQVATTTEVEDTLLGHPEHLVCDACVTGVENGAGDGLLLVRAWVVLTGEGKIQHDDVVAKKLNNWLQTRLSRHKWLTGGVETVESVCRLDC
jgi:4-coumarate--CoA ligase